MTADPIYDVILVGGGVMGCATACYLLQADETLRVAVVEMDSTYARNSTILSDGNARVQFNIKENIQISQYGLEVLANFSETMAVGDQKPDPAFRQQGNLFMTDAANEAFARQGYALQRSLDCQVEWLAPDQIAAALSPVQQYGGDRRGRLWGAGRHDGSGGRLDGVPPKGRSFRGAFHRGRGWGDHCDRVAGNRCGPGGGR